MSAPLGQWFLVATRGWASQTSGPQQQTQPAASCPGYAHVDVAHAVPDRVRELAPLLPLIGLLLPHHLLGNVASVASATAQRPPTAPATRGLPLLLQHLERRLGVGELDVGELAAVLGSVLAGDLL
jgi:hypothetical protein